ncbi:muscular LMNA-interacting protein [Chanos chanos]|uniref:Muscular LMNA-interacting protein n=1 Tax=Chanos chanos TaxID=29144 RepID=A0A6J2V8G3_CHACN|nr:muscular LMNA-interacting protein [Chanos chanos]
MTHEGVYKAEIVYIRESEEKQPEQSLKQAAHPQLKSSSDHLVTPLPPPPPLVTACSELDSANPKSVPAPKETTDNKHPSISHIGCQSKSPEAEVRADLFLNNTVQREEGVSPTNSVEMLASPTSSKESILSEVWDRDRSWSAIHLLSPTESPVPVSRTISQCSSIRSGAFSPAVVRLKRHSLAPGSSLIQMPPVSVTPCCNSLAPSPCPLSPRARHRPPPTQLSLLTAILRKGRLPILSPALQRPYTPCWPICQVNLSSCMACSAASSVASVCQDESRPVSSASTVRPCSRSCPGEEPQLESSKSSLDSLSVSSREHSSSGPIPPPSKCLVKPEYRSIACNSRVISPTQDSLLTKPVSHAQPSLPQLYKPVNKDVPSVSNVLQHSSFSRLRSLSPKASSLPCCNSTGKITPSNPPVSPIPKQVEEKSTPEIPNGKKTLPDLERVLSGSRAFRLSPPPRVSSLSQLSYTPPISPTCPSPKSNSRPTSPDYYTLSPSPAVSSRQLSPSPSYSLSSTPSPTPRASSTDLPHKKRKPYKIKSTYKALAAIPTNTLLLEQQAIDDEVDKGENQLNSLNDQEQEETHAEMCSPAQLRQQSEELYAVIDEVLEDSIHNRQSLPANKPSKKFVATETPKTKPGVIRPVNVAARLKEEEGEEYHPNPFWRYQDFNSDRVQYTLASKVLEGAEADGIGRPKSEITRKMNPAEELMDTRASPALLITEATEQQSPAVTEAASLNLTQVRMGTQETHI